MRLALLAATTIFTTATAQAQFELQDSHSTASFRGIHSIGNGVAWASGTEGTVLHTTDDGKTWQRCATPPDAEKLDFRGIQAFDQNTAIVMSSGKGDLSRLYKTTDGCKTWKLVFTNLEKDGFWDAIVTKQYSKSEYLLGDPVNGVFQYLFPYEGDQGFRPYLSLIQPGGQTGGVDKMPPALLGESSFAASNSSLIELPDSSGMAFATGGSIPKPRVISSICYLLGHVDVCNNQASDVPMASGPSAGIFSLAYRTMTEACPTQEEIEKFRTTNKNPFIYGPHCHKVLVLVAVGGDYMKSDSEAGTASFITIREKNYRDPQEWAVSQTPPHGYRSSVAYDTATKTWITTGPNGTDISRNDGKNWSALKPSAQDAPDADKNWNALSLPFVVGPKGRIGKLRSDALKR